MRELSLRTKSLPADARNLFAGINLVDWGPFAGNFNGTVVENNTFFANTAFMKIGVAVVRVPSFLRVRTSLISSFSQGGMTWGSYNVTAARTQVRISRSACSPSALTISLQGGVVRNNVFKSGSTGYFGYAIAVAGHVNADVTGNDARRAALDRKSVV